MASPMLRKLSPKSPLKVHQALTAIGVQQSAKPRIYLLESTPNNAECPVQKNGVGLFNKRRDFLCTPRSSKSTSGRRSSEKWSLQKLKTSPDSPVFLSQFSSTQACKALIQSPGRLNSYQQQRRRLYQDMPSCDSSNNITISTPSTAKLQSSTPKLGKGGFGSVFIGHYGGKMVAIKQLHMSQKAKVNNESFCGELNAFRLDHKNIVKILTFTCSSSVTQIVYEYVGRRNLQMLIDDLDSEQLDFKRCVRISLQIAEALNFCHKNLIVHLDVKPSNILLADNAAVDLCKLCDFGSSRRVLAGGATCSSGAATPPGSSASLGGTLAYRAPELLRGLAPTWACDVYSFGISAWQLQARHPPYADLHPLAAVFCVVAKHLRPACPHLLTPVDDRLIGLAQKCWAADPSQRPTFRQVCHELGKML